MSVRELIDLIIFVMPIYNVFRLGNTVRNHIFKNLNEIHIDQPFRSFQHKWNRTGWFVVRKIVTNQVNGLQRLFATIARFCFCGFPAPNALIMWLLSNED